jgi:glycosyl transferase, family 25
MQKPAEFEIEVLVVSMPSSSERRTSIRRQLDALGMRWRFLDAVVGKDLPQPPEQYAQKKRLDLYGYPMTPGELGCFLSHRLAWQECARQGLVFLVLEDDIELQPSFPKALQAAAQTQQHWDVLRLHGIKSTPDITRKNFGDLRLVENLKDPSSSAAYLVTPEAASHLLARSESFFAPIDDFLEFRFDHRLRLLAFKPNPVAAGIGESTIIRRTKPAMSQFKRLSREVHRIPLALKKAFWRLKRLHWDRPSELS